MCARYYENPTMLSKVTAKNVGDVFLRHTVESLLKLRKVCLGRGAGHFKAVKVECFLFLCKFNSRCWAFTTVLHGPVFGQETA